MATKKLLKIDASNVGDHYYLNEQDSCHYFHEYTARQGYDHSPGNGLISNLKKSVEKRGKYEYRYKEHAISQAAKLLAGVWERNPKVLSKSTVVPIPPSKCHADPLYDDRVLQIIELASADLEIDVHELIVQDQSYEASHKQSNGDRLKPADLRALYRLNGKPPNKIVILVDDVLTTGAHFVACRDTIWGAYPDTKIIGVFIARRINADVSDDFEAL